MQNGTRNYKKSVKTTENKLKPYKKINYLNNSFIEYDESKAVHVDYGPAQINVKINHDKNTRTGVTLTENGEVTAVLVGIIEALIEGKTIVVNDCHGALDKKDLKMLAKRAGITLLQVGRRDLWAT